MHSYRIAFAFAQHADISLPILSDTLRRMGERTFHVVTEEAWHHIRYDTDIMWNHDIDANIIIATIQGGESVRTCGSLVEWILRNASEYLDDPDSIQGISVFR